MTATLLPQLLESIMEARPKHARYLQEAEADLRDDERAELERYLQFMLGQGEDLNSLSGSYCALLDHTLEEQLYFQRHLEYRYSTLAEVADKVYFDESFMHDYMVGLAISLYLWPNHLAMHRFFAEYLPRYRAGRYLEVGPGHGNFLRLAMGESAYAEFVGVDISPTSIRLTGEIMRSALPDKVNSLELVLGDFLESPLPHDQFDAIVMGEVLEHVEQPELFLRRIVDLAAKDAFIFITTCVNAPELDHIYLFRHEQEVVDMLTDNGLTLVQSLTVPHHGHDLEACVKHSLPINMAYVLKRTA